MTTRLISKPPARSILAVLVAALAVAASGCGDDEKGGPIPSDQATEINSLLDQTQRRMDAGNACGDVKSQTLPRLDAAVNRLPGSVDHNTRTTLNDGVSHLRTLVDRECGTIAKQKEKARTETTPTETTPTETTPTETQTETTNTETTNTDTGDTNTNGGQTTPQNQGGGVGPGNGNGNSGGKSPED
jgi:hypothetical protein